MNNERIETKFLKTDFLQVNNTSNKLTFLNNLEVSGDLTVSGTLRYNEMIDTTVTGTISGYTGIFENIFANNLIYNTGNQNISGQKRFADEDIYISFSSPSLDQPSTFLGGYSGPGTYHFISRQDYRPHVFPNPQHYYSGLNTSPHVEIYYNTGTSRWWFTYNDILQDASPIVPPSLAARLPLTNWSGGNMRIYPIYSHNISHYKDGKDPIDPNLISAVALTGNQTISGIKTFINNQTFSGDIRVSGTGIFNALDLNNIDNLSLSGVDVTITSGIVILTNPISAPNLVYNTGNQTISGVKTFVSRPIVNGTGVLLIGEERTGRTIYVDATIGTDTRIGLSKYDRPFATIAAAVAASVTEDLVWVRKGPYGINSTISLDGKGDIQCEAGTSITVAGSVTAFTSNTPKTVIGDVFVLSDTAKLVAVGGGTLRFEFASISTIAHSGGTLFTVTAGTLDTSFAYIVAPAARAFELTGSGGMRIRRSHSVTCQQFLYANTTGGATIDLWTVIGSSPDAVFYIDKIAGLSYRGVNCNGSAGQNSYVAGYEGNGLWTYNFNALNFILTPTSARINSSDASSYGYALNTTTAQITSPSRYSFSSKLKWNASRFAGPETDWMGQAGLALSNSSDLGGNYLVIGLMPVLDDTWARPFIDFRLGENTGGFGIVYTDSTWNVLETTLNDNGAIRLQGQQDPAVITVVKTSKESLRVVINSPQDGDRIINIKFTTQEAIEAFASFNRFGYAAYKSDWTFSDQVIEGNLAPAFFFNYPQSTAGGGPIAEINPVLRNIRINVANPRTPATILTTNAQRYFYLDNVKIASWDNRLSIDSLTEATPVVAYDVYSNRPVGSNINVIGDLRQISTIF